MPRTSASSNRPPLWLAALALPWLLQGCASIVSGQTQVLSVDTPGCLAARCELSNDKGKWFVSSTPGTVSVNRSYNNLQVLCRKGGTEADPASFASTTKGMAFGNILFGGVIGAGVDVHSGAAYDYPQLLSVPMRCEPGALREAAAAPRPPRLGLQVGRAPQGTDGTPQPGAAVLQVEAGSPAERAGLQAGDLILRVNGEAVADPDALALRIARLREAPALELLVRNAAGEQLRRIEQTAQQRAL